MRFSYFSLRGLTAGYHAFGRLFAPYAESLGQAPRSSELVLSTEKLSSSFPNLSAALLRAPFVINTRAGFNHGKKQTFCIMEPGEGGEGAQLALMKSSIRPLFGLDLRSLNFTFLLSRSPGRCRDVQSVRNSPPPPQPR